MPDNIKNNKRTDDFNKVKKNFKNLLFRMKSTKTWIFIFFVGLLAAVMIIVENVSYYFFQKNLIEIEMAQLQTSAAVMSGEFSSYASFSEAEKNGVYERMRRYSAMNSVRIRVIDERFVIVSDSYLVEYGRNIINSNVINSFTTGKSISFYDRKNTNIEVAVPINGTDGSILGVLVVSKDLDEVYKNSVNDNIFTVMVAVIAVAVILVLLFERGIGKSYRKAYKIVEDVANGHTDKRIPAKGSYELRQFAKDFNNIMDRAGMLDESRQEFVSNVSHELKTPITSIMGYADTLLEGEYDKDTQQKFLGVISSEARRMARLVTDLLTLSKYDSKKVKLEETEFDLGELTKKCQERLKFEIEKKHQNVECFVTANVPPVSADKYGIERVVLNILSNAIKYTPENGKIKIYVGFVYNDAYIKIIDNGIGISEQDLTRIFDRFYRADKARTREMGGTGLGLSIAKEILDQNKGSIDIRSELGKGTEVIIRIPAKK
mgnify:CR=1 FL=1